MAITNDGMDKAEVTYCVWVDRVRMNDGSWSQGQFNLPWAFVRFGDPGEEQRYVMTLDGRSPGLTVPGAAVYRAREEVMRNSPFPHEADRPGKTGNNDDGNKPGDFAIHFIGPV